MNNNPVQSIISGAIETGDLRKVDPDYATALLTTGAKAVFFWPKFLVGQDSLGDTSIVLKDCVDMFLVKFGARD
ncbi:TetR/AcrR family transcriptional regulator C-terminal domain-containing protein [Ruegeria arenilitoris]|uniref:TetR/AcrR family transcriptional regulator C-terminal domain-containing protein n=1 Tax=Ruegeria arenilitoris TaxID=1173585 RepID=UPI0014812099